MQLNFLRHLHEVTFSSAPTSNDVRHRWPGGRYDMKSWTWTRKKYPYPEFRAFRSWGVVQWRKLKRKLNKAARYKAIEIKGIGRQISLPTESMDDPRRPNASQYREFIDQDHLCEMSGHGSAKARRNTHPSHHDESIKAMWNRFILFVPKEAVRLRLSN